MGIVLNRLYHDEMREEAFAMEEAKAARQAFMRHRDKLLARLDAPLQEQIQCLLEEREQVAALEKDDAYVRGTRMGAKMAVALLKKE